MCVVLCDIRHFCLDVLHSTMSQDHYKINLGFNKLELER